MSEEALRWALAELLECDDLAADGGCPAARLRAARDAAVAALSEGQEPDGWQDIANMWRTRAHATREECAALCERIGDETAAFYAAAIRALSEGQAPEPGPQTLAEWVQTDEGQAAIAKAHKEAEEACERLESTRRVTPEMMNTPLGATPKQAPEPVAQEPVAWMSVQPHGGTPSLVWGAAAPGDPVQEWTPVYTHPAGMDAARPKAEPVAQDRYVQPVPDHCDRIVWRGQYFGLPLTVPAGMDAARAKAIEATALAVLREIDEARIISASGDYIESRGPFAVVESLRQALATKGTGS